MPTTVTNPNGKTAVSHYDVAGRLITTTLPNNVRTAHGYDDANRLTSILHSLGSTTLAVYTYTLDALGNRTQVQDLAGTTVYTSNEQSWLATETVFEGADREALLDVGRRSPFDLACRPMPSPSEPGRMMP